MPVIPVQGALFESPLELPRGFVFRTDFLSVSEEDALLDEFTALPFTEARFQRYTARRRVVRYGEGDYPASRGAAGDEPILQRPFPSFLLSLRRRIAQWRGLEETALVHALITEYPPGTPIGWHRDAPHFDLVIGVSLGGSARMRFRPYAARPDEASPFELSLPPRSAYSLQGEIRWAWQHHIPAVKQRRYSITMRTLK